MADRYWVGGCGTWDTANTDVLALINSNRPQALGLSGQQLDQLFTTAASLEA